MSALSDAIGSIPETIMQAVQLRQASEQHQQQIQQNEQQMLLNSQAMEQARIQLKQQQKVLGMDRGGYGNEGLTKFFNDLILSKFSIRPMDGDWAVESGGSLPTQEQAWEVYQSFVGSGNITSADSDYFMKTLWPQVMKSHAGKITTELKILTQQGFSPRDLRLMMLNQPELQHNVGLVSKYLSETDPVNSAPIVKDLIKILPQKDVNVGERITGLGPAIGLTGAAAAGGYEYLKKTTTKTDIEKARKFADEFIKRGTKATGGGDIDVKTRTSDKLNKLNKDLEKAEKRKAKTPKSIKAKETRVSNINNKITNEKSRINQIVDRANKITKTKIADKTLWNKAMKKLPANKVLNLPVAALAPQALGAAGEYIGGESGRAVGSGFGGGIQTAYGGAKGISLAKHLMKVLPEIAKKKAVQGGAMAMADSPGLPFGDIAGMAWGLGSGGYEMYKAYQDWKLANQSY